MYQAFRRDKNPDNKTQPLFFKVVYNSDIQTSSRYDSMFRCLSKG